MEDDALAVHWTNSTYTEPRCPGPWCTGSTPEIRCGNCDAVSCTFCSEICNDCGTDCCAECIKVLDTPLGVDPPHKQCLECAERRHPCGTCGSSNGWGASTCFECGVAVCYSCAVRCEHALCGAGPAQFRCKRCTHTCARCKTDLCQYHLFKYSNASVCADCLPVTTAKTVAILHRAKIGQLPAELWDIVREFATALNLRFMHRRSVVPITSGCLGDWSIATRAEPGLTLATARAIATSLSPLNQLYCNGVRVMARVVNEKTKPAVQYIIGMPPSYLITTFGKDPLYGDTTQR